MPATASELEATLIAWSDCINKSKWDELPNHIYSKYVQNGQEYTPESFTEHAKKAMGALGEDVLLNNDLIMVDERAQVAAYNMWFKFKHATPFLGFEPTGREIFLVEHRFIWFTDSKLSKSLFVINFDDMRNQITKPDAANAPVLIGTAPVPAGNTLSREKLEETYRAYIDSINKHRTEANLGEYVHESEVVVNNEALTLAGYRRAFESYAVFIQDLRIHIHTLIVDEKSQRVAARLEITGTPTKEILGLVPDGHPVRLYEHATYQFLDGKIKKVWATQDLEEARQQQKSSK
ncbi:SnoaL-domain-containing protein [Whalleya microplaca]|nr:SnoaL-domain-containing protein [Whalleya microplaca]